VNTEKPKSRKLIHLIIGVAIIGGVIVTIYIIRSMGRVSTDDAYIHGRIHNIAPRIDGTVKKVCVDDNQDVKKGDVLIEIDANDYSLKVHQAQADLDAENARLLDAEAGIKTAMANLRVEEVLLHQATLDKNRADGLFKSGVITAEQHDKMVTTYEAAAAQVKAVSEQLEKAKAVKNLEEYLIKQKQALLDSALLNLSYTKIYAPCDGYVTNKSVETGDRLEVAEMIMAVVELDDVWVIANYKETQVTHVRPGQKARITVDTYPGKVFTGHVDSIMAGSGAVFSLFPPENALGNYVKVVQRIPVKIVLDKGTDDRHVLRIGMSCVPTIFIRDE
jgi:membrane fusion protein (multidrug efflux system)